MKSFPRRATLLEKFNDRVWRTSRCWLWQGYKTNQGYGAIYLNDTTYVTAHRIAWRLFRGAIPKTRIVCHTCDIRHCVNPDHLYLGTQKTNMQDALKAGHCNHGSSHGSSVLSAEQVKRIRAMPHRTQRELAKKFGVSQNTIWMIRHRKTWAWL